MSKESDSHNIPKSSSKKDWIGVHYRLYPEDVIGGQIGIEGPYDREQAVARQLELIRSKNFVRTARTCANNAGTAWLNIVGEILAREKTKKR